MMITLFISRIFWIVPISINSAFLLKQQVPQKLISHQPTTTTSPKNNNIARTSYYYNNNYLLLFHTGSTTRMPRGVKKENLPSKICVTCNRPFTWRKKWERCWDEVTTCSKSCNAKRRATVRTNNNNSGSETTEQHETNNNEIIIATTLPQQPKTIRITAAIKSDNKELRRNNNSSDDRMTRGKQVRSILEDSNTASDNNDASSSDTKFDEIRSDIDRVLVMEEFLDEMEILSDSNNNNNNNDDDRDSSLLLTEQQRQKFERKQRKKEMKVARRAQREGRGIDPTAGQKICDYCSKSVNLLVRCTIDESQKWNMVCGKCWHIVSGGVVDGDSSHPYYRYGGLWKNRRAVK